MVDFVRVASRDSATAMGVVLNSEVSHGIVNLDFSADADT